MEGLDKYLIDQLIKKVGFNRVVSYTIDNADCKTAYILYKNYRKRLHGKKYHLIESLTIMGAITNEVAEVE